QAVMQLYAPYDPYALICRLLIQRVGKRVVCGYRPVRPLRQPDRLQDLVPCQRLTADFHLGRGYCKARRHRCVRKGDPGHTRHLQDLLHLCWQALDLLLQEGLYTLRHPEISRVEGPLESPVSLVRSEDAPLDQRGHYGDQKQWIAGSVLA